MKKLLFIAGLIVLLGAEFLKVYLIMPFPGSQESSNVRFAYFLHANIWWIRLAGVSMVAPLVSTAFRQKRLIPIILIALPLLLYGLLFYACNFKFLADRIFVIQHNKIMLPISGNGVPAEKLIIGIDYKGQARAYPLEVIGYHHQVVDTVGGDPLLITYCTVCRSGRVYSPLVDGRAERFRLVGMDQFNAMFEDATTGSWWRQETGEAVAGTLAGRQLSDVPSMQMKLGAWMEQFPNTLILQPDPDFQKQYDHLKGFDEGTIDGTMEKRDTASWGRKSWVVGVVSPERIIAFDWNALLQKRLTIDRDIMVVVEGDGATFHAFIPSVGGAPAIFDLDADSSILVDRPTGSRWNLSGYCASGTCAGEQLRPLTAYQEFWHSWQTFHPETERSRSR